MATETFTYDRMFAGDADIITDSGTLITGQNLKRGAVLGKITASGKLTLVNSANTDGSQNPYAILAADTDATIADKICPIFIAGEFNNNGLVFGGTDTQTTTPASVGAVAWAATAAKAVGARVTPTIANGFVYVAIVAGTTAAAQPTWPQIDGATVVDGTATWQAIRLQSHKEQLRQAGIFLKDPVKA